MCIPNELIGSDTGYHQLLISEKQGATPLHSRYGPAERLTPESGKVYESRCQCAKITGQRKMLGYTRSRQAPISGCEKFYRPNSPPQQSNYKRKTNEKETKNRHRFNLKN